MKPQIIFINWGNPFYLKYSLSQCKGFNPDLKINLLGDRSSYGYGGVEHHDLSAYMNKAGRFEQLYRHYNTNNYKFELFCIQRWMIIHEFVCKKQIEQFMVMDSDVLLYYNVARDFELLKSYKMSLCFNHPAFSALVGTCHFMDPSILGKFADYCFEVYGDEKNDDFQTLLYHYRFLQSNNLPGGICDMNLWYLFYNENKADMVDLESFEDHFFYDQNINSPDFRGNNVLFQDGIKKVFLKRDTPYVYIENDNAEIRLDQLHFQGGAKKIMKDFVTKKGFYFWYNNQWITFKNASKTGIKKILEKKHG